MELPVLQDMAGYQTMHRSHPEHLSSTSPKYPTNTRRRQRLADAYRSIVASRRRAALIRLLTGTQSTHPSLGLSSRASRSADSTTLSGMPVVRPFQMASSTRRGGKVTPNCIR